LSFFQDSPYDTLFLFLPLYLFLIQGIAGGIAAFFAIRWIVLE
jgi:hypothetical protein